MAITVVQDVIWFVRRCNDRRDGRQMIRLKLRWPLWCMLDDLSDVAMTARMDARWFVQRSNDHRECMTVLIDHPGGSIWRMQSSGIFYTTIFRSDWTVLVVWSSGFHRDLLSTYFCDGSSDSYLGPSPWWWEILNLVYQSYCALLSCKMQYKVCMMVLRVLLM